MAPARRDLPLPTFGLDGSRPGSDVTTGIGDDSAGPEVRGYFMEMDSHLFASGTTSRRSRRSLLRQRISTRQLQIPRIRSKNPKLVSTRLSHLKVPITPQKYAFYYPAT
jgi:hypothetical protein